MPLTITVARFAAIVLAIVATSAIASAQRTPEGADSGAVRRIDPETADFFFEATVTADELHFDDVGEGTISFNYNQHRDTIHWVDRTALPSQVLPGVTYRDVGIHVEIISSFSDVDAIVTEALREAGVDVSRPLENRPAESPQGSEGKRRGERLR